MTLQQASKKLSVSKKRLWRAVKSGQLEASQVQKGGRWEYRVSQEQLDTYRRKYLDSLEMKAVSWSETERAPGRVEMLEAELGLAHERIFELEGQLSEALGLIREAREALLQHA